MNNIRLAGLGVLVLLAGCGSAVTPPPVTVTAPASTVTVTHTPAAPADSALCAAVLAELARSGLGPPLAQSQAGGIIAGALAAPIESYRPVPPGGASVQLADAVTELNEAVVDMQSGSTWSTTQVSRLATAYNYVVAICQGTSQPA